MERLDRAYREANRLVVAAGLVLASAGIPRSAPVFRALSAALRAVNLGRDLLLSTAVPDSRKEVPHAYSASSGQRFRRAAP